ncbi:MAG TPA: arginyltransferase [Chromatiales bacterium]|nr:arginyltransferase [Thiotrichales bacterium]HIP69760.1 arginyltransferase [Chromatiales bacterium]
MTAAWQSLTLYLSPPYGCSYLPEQIATNAVIDPSAELSPALYNHLLNKGFRRSGNLVYRPHCKDCQACIATRIPVEDFQPSRNQRRTWKRNQDLTVTSTPARHTEEYFDLYKRYLGQRHPGGGMENPTPESFEDFLLTDWGETIFIEFRNKEKLLGVAVADVIPDGFSAMYTFFDPTASKRSLGTYAVLWLIETARRENKPWVYLGYWIESCQKMQYKTRFQLIEGFQGGEWQLLSDKPI